MGRLPIVSGHEFESTLRVFAGSEWVDRWIKTHRGAGKLAEGFLVWCLFYRPEYKPIGEAFCYGCELLWKVHAAMDESGIDDIKIKGVKDLLAVSDSLNRW